MFFIHMNENENITCYFLIYLYKNLKVLKLKCCYIKEQLKSQEHSHTCFPTQYLYYVHLYLATTAALT